MPKKARYVVNEADLPVVLGHDKFETAVLEDIVMGVLNEL